MKNEPTDRTVLVLQGGGALGAYQAGALEALVAAGRTPHWVAGISIGSINAALIAGNPPGRRIERLRAFWDTVSADLPEAYGLPHTGPIREWANTGAAAYATLFGASGFFAPRPGALFWPGELPNPSYFDTSPLRATLCELVDFDLINDNAGVRLSVGAVDVRTGNFCYFDSAQQRIGPEHIMASGALPPGFPAIEIEGHAYWDGGLVSNTPLRHVLNHVSAASATVFQIDLFSARGALPKTMAGVAEREKDIQYSSRTRMVTDMLRERHLMHRRLRELAAMLPATRRADPKVRALLADIDDTAITLVHLIHRHTGGETQTKDFEFSRASMRAHWDAGRDDMSHTLKKLAHHLAPPEPGSFHVYDFTSVNHTEGATP
ncbi:MAG: patatin-like phospholipase family protein [Burkholderiaceae bacterium]